MSQIVGQFIDGQICEAKGVKSQNLSPWGEHVISEWIPADEMDVVRAIQAAKKFLARATGWPVEERNNLLQKMHQVVAENSLRWSRLEAETQGLPQSFVLENSFLHAQEILQKTSFPQIQEKILSPSGVVAVITSWNLSFRLVMESLIPAVAAGNAVIVKVSSKSAITLHILAELASACEFPAGSLGVIIGDGAKVGSFLAAHPGVRAVSFVGKTKTAEALLKQTAPLFKKLKIRGSQKNSCTVLPGWTADMIPEILKSFLIGGGQLGWNMSRILMTETEAPKFVEALEIELPKLKTSQSPSDENYLLPLTTYKLTAEVQSKAITEHAKILPGARPEASFLLDLPNCSDLQQEELPAPVFPIVTVKYAHELSKWANNTAYGNLATIWGDPEKAKRYAAKLEFGGIWVNHWMRKGDLSPWGLKTSAFGISDNQAFGPFYSDEKLTL